MSYTRVGSLLAPRGQMDERPAVRASPEFSERELGILKLLARDCGNKEIADRLGISRQAVANRQFRLYEKLGVHRAAGAVSRALVLGLITLKDCENG